MYNTANGEITHSPTLPTEVATLTTEVTNLEADKTVGTLTTRVASLKTLIATLQASNNGKPYVFAAGSFDFAGAKANGMSYDCSCKAETLRGIYGTWEYGHYTITFDTDMPNDNYSIMIQQHVKNNRYMLNADVYEKSSNEFSFRMSGTVTATFDSFIVTLVD